MSFPDDDIIVHDQWLAINIQVIDSSTTQKSGGKAHFDTEYPGRPM